ncbi:ATP-binding protein [Streptomyces sp. NPDC017529]|uniref:ATP-binding protein n=1 Tax=Streptomyces sp. NPDC017529 TaxID=3365000 RepID=UPI003789396C
MIAPHDPAEVVLHEDLLDYTPFPKAVALARRRAVRLVGEWGHEEIAGDVGVLVSELATNALVHGRVKGRLFRVHLVATGRVVRVAVSDVRGEALPAERDADEEDLGGRGLVIVRGLAARWGVRERGVGKTVWCEVEVRQE